MMSDIEAHPLPLAKPLTPREQEILTHISHDLTNREIAVQLTVALSTVKWYVRQIYNKLGVDSRTEAVTRGQQLSLLPVVSSEIRHNLPADMTPFIGREKALSQVEQRLAQKHVRLLSIIGLGGSGKTRLALALGRRVLRKFADGLFFVQLAPLISANNITAAIADAVGLPLTSQLGRTPTEQLANYLREKKVLLILDNFEHLLDGKAVVTRLLQEAPNVKILTTSRQVLQLPGENLFPLYGLEKDDAMSEAHSLFVHCAQRLRPQIRFDEVENRIITQICQQVDGMPLAIELAAAWINVLPLAKILLEIEQSLDILTTNDISLPRRQQSMRAVCASAWHRLSKEEQRIFAGLFVFRGGFTREAAQAILGASLHQLARLQSKSLLQYNRRRDRYQVHELLRQFAAEMLQEDETNGRYHHVCEQHAVFYCRFLQRCGEQLKGAEQKTAVAEIDRELENVRVAWHWVAKQRNLAWLEQAMDGIFLFYEWRSQLKDGLNACQQALTAVQPIQSEKNIRLQIRLLVWQARFADGLGKHVEASGLVQNGLELLQQLEKTAKDCRRERALLWGTLAIFEHVGNGEEQRSSLQKSIALLQELGDQWQAAVLRIRLANIAFHQGKYEAAKRLYYQSLSEFERLEDRLNMGRVQAELAVVLRHMGQMAETEHLLQASLSVVRDLGDHFREVSLSIAIAATYREQGRYADGILGLKQSARVCRDLGYVTLLADVKSIQGHMLVLLGRYQEAKRELQEAWSLYTSPNVLSGINQKSLGMIALAEGKPTAKACLMEALAILEDLNNTRNQGETFAFLAMTHAIAKEWDEANRALLKVLHLAVDTRAILLVWEALAAAALLAAAQSQTKRAVELYALATTEPFINQSPFFAEVVGQRVSQCVRDLSSNEVTRLQARGRKLDMWETVESLLTAL